MLSSGRSCYTYTNIINKLTLSFYAILRSIPDKLGGILAMVAAIIVVGLLPFIVPTLNIRSSYFRPITRKLF